MRVVDLVAGPAGSADVTRRPDAAQLTTDELWREVIALRGRLLRLQSYVGRHEFEQLESAALLRAMAQGGA